MKKHLLGVFPATVIALFLALAPPLWCETPAPNAPVAPRPEKPRQGEIVKVEGNLITTMPLQAPANNQLSEPQTYVVDAETHISIAHLISEETTPSGGLSRSFRTKLGERADLKVGRQVRIEAEGGRAVRIVIMP